MLYICTASRSSSRASCSCLASSLRRGVPVTKGLEGKASAQMPVPCFVPWQVGHLLTFEGRCIRAGHRNDQQDRSWQSLHISVPIVFRSSPWNSNNAQLAKCYRAISTLAGFQGRSIIVYYGARNNQITACRRSRKGSEGFKRGSFSFLFYLYFSLRLHMLRLPISVDAPKYLTAGGAILSPLSLSLFFLSLSLSLSLFHWFSLPMLLLVFLTFQEKLTFFIFL